MSHYEYSSNSLSSNAAATGGFNGSKALFNHIDTNQDGAIDRSEFHQWIAGGSDATGQTGTGGSRGLVGSFESSSFESSSYSLAEGGDGAFNADGGHIGAIGGSSFESSGFSSSTAIDAGIVGGNAFQISSAESTRTGSGFDVASTNQAANYTAETNAAWSKYGAEVKGIGLYVDANPEIIRRPAIGGIQTYTQKIKVRFLQPPPIPPPGPLIIKEVRPPQPAPPPPLRIRQQAPPLPQPPPLILRERPPPPPPSQASQTVVRQLPALPPPPRSVIIERIPAAPSRPRDIIIERWLPYGAESKRKTIVQRAEATKDYPKPRNIIIQYEPVQIRIVRQFQHLGVIQENPQAYIQRYGAQLLDCQTLIQQARAAGVVEDISPPAGAASTFNSSSFSQEALLSANGVSGEPGGGSKTSFSTRNFENSNISGLGSFAGVGFESGLVEGVGLGAGYGSSSFESSAYLSGTTSGINNFGVESYLGAGINGGYSSSLHESSNFASQGVGSATGFDTATVAFNSVDKNKDSIVDAHQFKQFYHGGL